MSIESPHEDNSRKWIISVILFGFCLLLYLLSPMLSPFMLSALLAYLGDPLVDRLESRKFPRTIAVTSVFFGLFFFLTLLILIVVPLLEQQISSLIHRIPSYLDWIQRTVTPWVAQKFGIDEQRLGVSGFKGIVVEHWQKAGGIAALVLRSASQSGMTFLVWTANLVLIPVVTFYLLRDWDILVNRIRELVPKQYEPTIVRLAQDSDMVLGAFLRGQVSVMFALGLIYSIGLWLAGLDFGILIGVIAGIVSFVPYLGFIIGILLAGIATIMQFHEFYPLIWVFAVFAVGQMLEGMLLTPWLVGDKIGLHPVAVIFSVLAGGQLFGFFGILLALPVAAIVMVLLRFFHEHYITSSLYARR